MNLNLLKQLSEAPGVPGREERVRAIVEREAKTLFDEVTTDNMGSLIATKRAKTPGAKRVLAWKAGYGFVMPEDEAVAMRRAGKQVLNVDDAGAAFCLPADGDHLVVSGDVNGDGAADFAINVYGTTKLTAGDFLL